MHFTFNNILSAIIICFCIVSCKKEDKVSDVPQITFVNVSPSDIKEFQHSLIFTIHYKDGNGDLGEDNPDVKNLFLTDNRIGVKYDYRLQQLAPDNSSIAIEGNFRVELASVSITDNSSLQNATFSVYVTDRAGNKSNVVTSSNIVIRK